MNVELLRTISILIIYLSPICVIIGYLYCLHIYYLDFPKDKYKPKLQKMDIEWNYNFKVNEYYNQFGDNLKILINT